MGRPPSLRAFCQTLSPHKQGLASWQAYKPSLLQSLEYVAKQPQNDTALPLGEKTLTWGDLRQSLEELLALLPRLEHDPQLLAERFSWLKIEPGTLFTGYYEPGIEASLTPSPAYPYPLYGVPADLDSKNPYYDRRAIDTDGVLRGKGLEIAWAKDPVDVFFLQVQGSGRLNLPDGSGRHILYAADNGLAYVSLGKVCIERGLATRESMSMQTLRTLLSGDAAQRESLLNCNPRYIFFKLAKDGPFGAMGAKLTPLVSAAVDRSFFPLGAIFLTDALLPQPKAPDKRRFSGLLLAQDTGAFQGNHVDLFCGHGTPASFLAGHMRDKAAFWLLIKKNADK